MKIKFYICAVMAVVLLVSATVYTKSRHDLSGTYYTSEFFPVTAITFSTDGTFTANNEFETLSGKYSKKGGLYSLKFTDGKSNNGNPVSNYMAASAGSQYELEAEKIDDGHFRVYVIAGISYWAWLGKYADFYKVGTDMTVNDSENDIGRPPEEDCISIDSVESEAVDSNIGSDGYINQYQHNTQTPPIERTEYINGNYCSRTEYEYDADYNLTAEKVYDSSDNMLECKTYDKKGNLTESKSYGGGEVYQCYGYEYDTAGNLIKKELEYGSSEGGPSIIKYEYDEMGNMVKCLYGGNDINGSFQVWTQESYEYDMAGNLLSKMLYYQGDSEVGLEPSEQRYEYEYEDNGKLVREISFDSSGNKTSWIESGYDEMGNEIKNIFYDANGNITSRTEFEYDEMGNVVKAIYYNISGNITNLMEYTYMFQ